MSFVLRLILFLICSFKLAVAQNVTSRVFSANQGLPDTYIYSITQDREGFLWIATGKGLARFDGKVFLHYALQSDVQDDIIYSGAVDVNNELWFGTFSGKIYKLDRTKNRLKLYPKAIKGSLNEIILSKNNNRLYFFSKGNGIYFLEKNKLQEIPFSQNYQINSLKEIDQNTLLIATDEGFFIIRLGTNTVIKLDNFDFDIAQLQKLEKTTNGYLILTGTGRIMEVRVSLKGEIEIIKVTDVITKVFPDGVSTFCYNESNADLYLGTKTEHFAIYNLNTGKLKSIDENDFQADVNKIFIDKEQIIWVATTGKGLYRLQKEEFDYVSVNNESIFSIAQDTAYNTYYATRNGVLVANTQGDIYKTINRVGNKKLEKINALYIDKQNKLWIGTNNQGLFVMDLFTSNPVKLEFSTISNISVNAINGTQNTDEVQVCTNLDGVYNYHNYNLANHFSVQNSLLHNNVFSSLKCKTNKIYYATHNTSFNFSKDNQIYEIDIKDNGLTSDFNCFAESHDGSVIIGTNGKGIYRLNDTSITPFDFNNRLESQFCKGLLYDKDSTLWLMLGNSLYRYYYRNKVLSRVNFKESYNSSFNPNAFYKNDRGDLFFGTNNYVIQYTHNKGKNDLTRLPKTYLLNLRINDSLISVKNNLDLEYGKYNFKFEYSTLSLKNSEDVTFKYMLVGRDENWCELTKSRKAEFSNLPHGSYTFKVIAYNSEGFSEIYPTAFHFSIRAPFWQTTFFWVIVTILVAFLIVAIVKIRTASLVAAKIKLEKIVNKKTKELREEKEVVEMNNKIIESQNHEITSSITYAKRIQEAILPDKNINQKFRDSIFVYYLPKDIVSGDFYWYAEKEKKFLVGVFDCTGHGVPGAFMSMIGTTLLNKIVFDKGELDPAKILLEMDKEVTKSLRQEDSEVNDGMEGAICCIDFFKNEIAYAGAKRPLLIYRKSEVGFELQEYKPDKFSIGGYADTRDKCFTTHRIKVKKGDMMYLFSDGIVDQFNGENKGRISSKRVKDLFLNIAASEIVAQSEEIKEFISDWKGETKQTDDILVVGVRF